MKTKFEALHDTTTSLSARKKYTHFETACKEIAAKLIPLKPKLKNVYQGHVLAYTLGNR